MAYIHSSEEATQVAQARERALVKAEDALERLRNGLGGRYYKTREQVQRRIGQILAVNITGLINVTVTTPNDKLTVTWQRNQPAIDTAASFDGIYALATNLPGRITAGQILRLYKDQQIVERRHRDMKQTLKVRPIFLHNDDRVHALLSIVGISLLIFGLIEAQTRAALGDDQQLPGLLPKGRAARPTGRNILAAFQGLGLTYTHTGIQLDPLTDTQQHILNLSKSTRPGPHRQTMPSRAAENGYAESAARPSSRRVLLTSFPPRRASMRIRPVGQIREITQICVISAMCGIFVACRAMPRSRSPTI